MELPRLMEVFNEFYWYMGALAVLVVFGYTSGKQRERRSKFRDAARSNRLGARGY